MLHTVNKSAFSNSALDNCLDFAKDKDSVLLYEDAVVVAQKGSKLESKIQDALKKLTICALEEDLNARGIKNIIDGIKIVNYSGFVDLVEQNKVAPWL